MKAIRKTHRKQKKEKKEKTRRNEYKQCDESIFLHKEIIDAIRKSEEKMEIHSRKPTRRWTNFCRLSRIQSEHNSMG